VESYLLLDANFVLIPKNINMSFQSPLLLPCEFGSA
jgi:hypothetical protein